MRTNSQAFFSHTTVLAILLIVSVGINCLLAFEIRSLRASLIKLDADIDYDRGLLVGEKSPQLSILDEDEKLVSVNHTTEELPVILYIFTPDCHFCTENLESIKKLAELTKGKYRFIPVSLRNEGLKEYVVKNKILFTVYHTPPKDVYRSFKLGKTPQTYVISKDGYIVANWAGMYSDRQNEVEGFFDIKLPVFAEQKQGD